MQEEDLKAALRLNLIEQDLQAASLYSQAYETLGCLSSLSRRAPPGKSAAAHAALLNLCGAVQRMLELPGNAELPGDPPGP